MAAKKEAEKTSFFARVNNYFRDVRAEAKRVVWPTGKQLRNNTAVVLVMVVVFGVFVWGIDAVMGLVTDLILGS